MFCKHCGTQIDDDSIYCNKCGEKQKNNEIEEKIINAQENEVKNKNNKNGGKFIIGIIICFLITLAIITIIDINKNPEDYIKDSKYEDSNDDTPQLFTRDARINDVTITTETNYNNLGIDIIILPNVDIEGLEIKLIHYDKNGKELLTQYKTIGNVKEGLQVKTQVQLLDFSITDMFKVNNTKIEIIEGTVSYFD